MVSRRRAALFLLTAGSAFATSGPIARACGPTHPLLIAGGRVLIAGLLLLLLEPRAVAASLRALPWPTRLGVAGAGALLGLHFWLFTCGLQATSLPAAVALVSLEPLAVVLCGWAIHRLPPSRGELAGVLVATAGALVVAGGAGIGEHRLAGDLLVLAAVVLYGFYIAAARSFRAALPSRHYAAAVYLAAATACAALLPFVARPADLALPGRAAVGIVALALLPTLLGHTAVQTAARTLSPSLVALVSPGETVGGLLIGALLLAAPPSGRELLGAVIILAGVSFALLGTARPAAA